jgi:hypothetical protein
VPAYRDIKAYGGRGHNLEIIALIQNSDAFLSFTIYIVRVIHSQPMA